tara:strand:+ start:2869 stop:4338 length:1470 start_codon:yes stop_codon:yes gene_type:complete
MANLSDLLPQGGGQNNTDFVADGNISAGAPVILTSDGKVSGISETAGSMGTPDDQGTSYQVSGTSGAAYHITNNSIILCWPAGASNYYPTAAVATISGTTMTMNSPTVITSSGTSFCRCVYDQTQNVVVFYYKLRGGSSIKCKAATVSGSTFSFGSEASAFSGSSYGDANEGDISNLDDSKVVICWGNVSGSSAQVVSISGTSLTMNTAVSVFGGNTIPLRMASGKKGEFVCAGGSTSKMSFVACTVSGTTITAGTATDISGGTSQYNDIASGFWNGYTSPESTYIAAYHDPGASGGTSLARVITVSGTTLTLGATTSLTADPDYNEPAMGWGGSATQAVYYYRSNSSSSDGKVVELNYSGTTITEGSITTVGYKNYSNWGVTTDQSVKKSIVLYMDGSNSDAAEVNVFSPTSSNLTATNLLGIAAGAISDTATGTINTWGSRNEAQSSLTIGSDYYVQNNGTITTSSDGQLIGKAITATQINIKDYTG